MKKGTTYILICLTVVMSLIGLLIWYNVTKTAGEKNPLDADVTLNGNTAKELSVDFKDLKPGSDGQYVINLNAKNARDYSVVLKFRGDGQIKDFIDVEVTTDAEGFECKKSKLADLLGGEEMDLGKGATKITVRYSMPVDVGNEAQGAEATFFIELVASL